MNSVSSSPPTFPTPDTRVLIRPSSADDTTVAFDDASLLRAARWKHQRWFDVALMQKRFGRGAMEPPLVGPPSEGTA